MYIVTYSQSHVRYAGQHNMMHITDGTILKCDQLKCDRQKNMKN